MTWGLVPSWTKKEEKLDFFRMFNARSETVPEKTVFSRLLGSKRCVVLLNGFYEWAQVSSISYIENPQSPLLRTVQAAVLRYHHPY